MNLLKALNGLQTPNGGAAAPENEEKLTPTSAPPAAAQESYNAMASVLERHERISNRVRNKR